MCFITYASPLGTAAKKIAVAYAAPRRKSERFDPWLRAGHNMFQVKQLPAYFPVLEQNFRQNFSVAARDIHQRLSLQPAEIVRLERRRNQRRAELRHRIVKNFS